MNEKQAEILISINETKNITETARILKLTQPTISFHMKNMEKEYTDLGNPENADFSSGGGAKPKC